MSKDTSDAGVFRTICRALDGMGDADRMRVLAYLAVRYGMQFVDDDRAEPYEDPASRARRLASERSRRYRDAKRDGTVTDQRDVASRNGRASRG